MRGERKTFAIMTPNNLDEAQIAKLAGSTEQFRLFVITTFTAYNSELKGLNASIDRGLAQTALNTRHLQDIELRGSHGLQELRRQVEAHEEQMGDIRQAIADHVDGCPMKDELVRVNQRLISIETFNAARVETLKEFQIMQATVKGLQSEKDRRDGEAKQKGKDRALTLALIPICITLGVIVAQILMKLLKIG